MSPRILGTVALLLLCLSIPGRPWSQEWSHSPPEWRTLSPGLLFAEVQVFHNQESVDNLAVVKIDPALNAFRVFYRKPQTLKAWQEETQALVVFNASYFTAEGQPVALILVDGTPMGPRKNPRMRGMFVAEPRGMSPDLPRATILDLQATPVKPHNLPWSQGVQSFPLLLDSKGRIRVRESQKKSHRTVIAADRKGNILVFNTNEDYFTLYDLARFLKASDFEVDSALNLDGGAEAQLYIKTQDFEYFSPSTWKSRLGKFLEHQRFLLPTVVGVFPRKP